MLRNNNVIGDSLASTHVHANGARVEVLEVVQIDILAAHHDRLGLSPGTLVRVRPDSQIRVDWPLSEKFLWSNGVPGSVPRSRCLQLVKLQTSLVAPGVEPVSRCLEMLLLRKEEGEAARLSGEARVDVEVEDGADAVTEGAVELGAVSLVGP